MKSKRATPGGLEEQEKEKSKYRQLQELLQAYEKILHPDIFRPIMKLLNEVYEEQKDIAYREAKISPEALELEKIIKHLLENLKFHGAGDNPQLRVFYHKMAFKDCLKVFNKVEEDNSKF
ncbi:MAG TPA: hypothetical protein VFV08_12255 [Puia sp.]|nr:hypothetical protein [Puia sp.]